MVSVAEFAADFSLGKFLQNRFRVDVRVDVAYQAVSQHHPDRILRTHVHNFCVLNTCPYDSLPRHLPYDR